MLKLLISFIFVLTSSVAYSQDSKRLEVELSTFEKPNWTEQEVANAKLIADFVQNLMNNHNFDYIIKQYNNSDYIQHNRNLPDKVTGLVSFMKEFVEDYPEYGYDVKHVYVDGNYVVFHSHVTLNKEDRGNDQKGMNIIDTWRLEEGKIVEHWDAIQALDLSMRVYALFSGGDIVNSNGVF
ncbi:polyketide cyclase [Pseudoalteromonas sp. MSK9-3]|uniref:nuclear transport factor 2 family protein n=1 Tax=Pseudoalteromonas sp. MSK9-3 TaxID=1897633 RepID=UPI000E6CFC46|nr:nuclear transport factor 2 family protein [Pseudoalteromonas sp. MSK9-3]RJE71085.1 polyketide cyclase [Pseudoalteromonas sp. MSK9-3]